MSIKQVPAYSAPVGVEETTQVTTIESSLVTIAGAVDGGKMRCEVTLVVGDIQIGAVEFKDAATDARAKVGAGDALAAGDNAVAVGDANVKAAVGAVGDTAAEGDAASGSVIARLRGIAKAVGTAAAGLLFDIEAHVTTLAGCVDTARVKITNDVTASAIGTAVAAPTAAAIAAAISMTTLGITQITTSANTSATLASYLAGGVYAAGTRRVKLTAAGTFSVALGGDAVAGTNDLVDSLTHTFAIRTIAGTTAADLRIIASVATVITVVQEG